MKRIIAFVVCLILLSQQAEAVRGRRRPPSRPQDGLKSKTTARQLSYGCTFIPVAAGGAIVGFSLGKSAGQETTGWVLGVTTAGLGLTIGPIIGHNYAGKRWSTPGLKFRIAGFAAGGLGALGTLFLAETDGLYKETSLETSEEAELVIALFACGTALLLAASIVDLATVDRSVDEYNRKHAAPSLSIAPGYNPSSGTFGLTASVRF